MVVHLIFGPAAPARRQYRAPLEGFRLSSPRPFSRHHRSDVVILCASDRFSTSDRFSRGASASNAFPTCLDLRSVSKVPSARRLLVRRRYAKRGKDWSNRGPLHHAAQRLCLYL